MGQSKSTFKKVYTDISILQETKNLKQPILPLKHLEKGKTKPNVSRRKEIKIRKEINKIDLKTENNKTKDYYLEYKINNALAKTSKGSKSEVS